MVNVCVGPELEPSPDGRLRIRLCGGPPEEAWPYPCVPGQGNPLRVDPDCGLWLPPRPQAAMVAAAGATAQLDQIVPEEHVVVETAQISVTNPSACHEAMVLRMVSADVDFTVPAGAGAHVSARLAANEYQDFRNPAPASGTALSFTHFEYWEPMIDGEVIPPGETVTYSADIEVGQGTGGARYRGCRWKVRALVLAGMA